MKIFKGIKRLNSNAENLVFTAVKEKVFPISSLVVFVEADAENVKKRNTHCLIGCFDDQGTHFYNIPTNEVIDLTPEPHVKIAGKKYDSIYVTKETDMQQNFLDTKLTLHRSILDGTNIYKSYDMLYNKEVRNTSPYLALWCDNSEKEAGLSKRNVKRMTHEIDALVKQKISEKSENKTETILKSFD